MATDAPIGRWGFVIENEIGGGSLDLEPLRPGRQFYCKSCRGWYMAESRGCPECGREPSGFNKEIRTKQLNRHLFETAAHQEAQK